MLAVLVKLLMKFRALASILSEVIPLATILAAVRVPSMTASPALMVPVAILAPSMRVIEVPRE
jgi:hypothetical protein